MSGSSSEYHLELVLFLLNTEKSFCFPGWILITGPFVPEGHVQGGCGGGLTRTTRSYRFVHILGPGIPRVVILVSSFRKVMWGLLSGRPPTFAFF